jgi:hypothetical protein
MNPHSVGILSDEKADGNAGLLNRAAPCPQGGPRPSMGRARLRKNFFRLDVEFFNRPRLVSGGGNKARYRHFLNSIRLMPRFES